MKGCVISGYSRKQWYDLVVAGSKEENFNGRKRREEVEKLDMTEQLF